jgi:hypothetical protein
MKAWAGEPSEIIPKKFPDSNFQTANPKKEKKNKVGESALCYSPWPALEGWGQGNPRSNSQERNSPKRKKNQRVTSLLSLARLKG